MGSTAVMEAVRDAIIANFDGFDANNCSVEDEEVFNYIQKNDGTKCCIVGLRELGPEGSAVEFGGMFAEWGIVINAFFRLSGPDYTPVLTSAREFLDDFISYLIAHRTFSGSFMKASIKGAGPTLVYKRNDNFVYILMPIQIGAIQNVES